MPHHHASTARFTSTPLLRTIFMTPNHSIPIFSTLKIAPLVLLLGMPLYGQAQEKGFISSTTPDFQGVTPALGGATQLAPFKYIPPAGASNSAQQAIEAQKRSPDQQRIVDLNTAGDYQTAGTEGLALIATSKPDDALILMIANSLAWTGRLNDAVQTYQSLTKGPLANDANVGLANIQRWRGRDDLATPLYKSVLEIDPGNSEANAGLSLAGRELSPRTVLSFGGSSDSSNIKRRSATLNHRWRDSTGANIFEVETSKVNDESLLNQAQQQDVSLRFKSLSLALKPSFELSMPTNENRTLFGSVRINLEDELGSLEVGRVNWGRIATNPNALAAGMAATHVGLSGAQTYSFGKISGRINYFNISDQNTILTSSVLFDAAWRPFGAHIKPFLGAETREAKFNTTNYWSPEFGTGTAFAGLAGEWGDSDWTIYSSAQISLPLFGEAGTGWSISAGGKQWLTNDIALSLNLWSMASKRDAAEYRAKSAFISLEKLWR
jgi:hypothetical protein